MVTVTQTSSLYKTRHIKPWSRWATAAEDHRGRLSYYKGIRNWCYNSLVIIRHWTAEYCKNVAWSYESRYLLRHSDVKVRIWRSQPKRMYPSCLVTMVVFLPSTGTLDTNKRSFKCCSLPRYCSWPTLQFMSTDRLVGASSTESQRKKIMVDWSMENSNEFSVSN